MDGGNYTPVQPTAPAGLSRGRRLVRAGVVWAVWVGSVAAAVVLGMRGAGPGHVVAAVPWFVLLVGVVMLPAAERG